MKKKIREPKNFLVVYEHMGHKSFVRCIDLKTEKIEDFIDLHYINDDEYLKTSHKKNYLMKRPLAKKIVKICNKLNIINHSELYNKYYMQVI